jgi:hypothetical protein
VTPPGQAARRVGDHPGRPGAVAADIPALPELEKDAPAIDADTLLLLVVGAHLKAELADRPQAQRLIECIGLWQETHAGYPPLRPIICSDLWYLNDRGLHDRPAIIIGDPAVNAAAAFFANRLPTALVVENTFEVQIDVEFIDLHACLWGVNQAGTTAAVDAFIKRFLNDFLRACHAPAAAVE